MARGTHLDGVYDGGSDETTLARDIGGRPPVALDAEDARHVSGADLASQRGSSGSCCSPADGVGSTLAVVDIDGDVVNEFSYRVFGGTAWRARARASEFQSLWRA